MYFFRSSNMLSTALLILSVLPLLARGDHKFPWQDMDRMNNMNDTFNGTSHSFNVSMSWSICMRLVYDVPYDPEITDYAPVISNLLQVLHTFGGGAVRLDNGTFPVNSGIDMPSHTCIVGMGPNKTVIQLTPFAPSFYPKKGIIRSRFAERVSLQGITIDGNRHKQAMTAGATYGRDGLSFIHVNYAWLRNVVSRDNHGLGCKLLFFYSYLSSPSYD